MALDRYRCQVTPQPPELTSFPEARVDRLHVLIALEVLGRHGFEIVDEGQIDDDCAGLGSDVVVLCASPWSRVS